MKINELAKEYHDNIQPYLNPINSNVSNKVACTLIRASYIENIDAAWDYISLTTINQYKCKNTNAWLSDMKLLFGDALENKVKSMIVFYGKIHKLNNTELALYKKLRLYDI